MIVNLKDAADFIKRARRPPASIEVSTKAWVRIRRDLQQLSRVLPTPFSAVAPEDRWLWHENKKMRRHVELRVLGVPVKRTS